MPQYGFNMKKKSLTEDKRKIIQGAEGGTQKAHPTSVFAIVA